MGDGEMKTIAKNSHEDKDKHYSSKYFLFFLCDECWKMERKGMFDI